MLGKLGINLDFNNPGGRPEPQTLALFGWARLMARPDPNFAGYLERLEAAGIRTVVILGNESFLAGDRAGQAMAYAQRVHPSCWQIGNEPDGQPPASWTMAPATYAALVTACVPAIRQVQPTAWVVSAGLTSGDPGWLARCGPLPLDGVAVHPYGRRPQGDWPTPTWGVGTLDDLLAGYARYGLPLWITEFGTDDTSVQADYYARMYAALAARPDVAVACAFCYSDAMVSPYGLVDRTGVPKPAYITLQEYLTVHGG